MQEIELSIRPDGLLEFSRENPEQDKLLKEFLSDLVDHKVLDSFFYTSKNTEIIFGGHTLCG